MRGCTKGPLAKDACVSGTACVSESGNGRRCVVPTPVKAGGTFEKTGLDKLPKGSVCEGQYVQDYSNGRVRE